MTHSSRGSRQRSGAVRAAAHITLTLTAFFMAGALGGVIWQQVWNPPTGIVVSGTWVVTSEDGYRAFFNATGWFVVLSAGFGLALGLISGLLTRERELVALAGIAVGSVLAALVMWRVGLALSAPDPAILARGAEDQTLLEGRISVGGWSPFLAFPAASLFGLLVPFVMLPGRQTSSAATVVGPESPSSTA